VTYTTAKEVFLAMERYEQIEETRDNISNGDTIELNNIYPVKDTVSLTVDSVEQVEDTDFTVDYDKAEISYTGDETGSATIEYASAPFSNTAVQNSIEAVVDYIDDYTNSTYGGLGTVQGEIYDTQASEKVYVFDKRPVESVDDVSLNRPDSGEPNPTYKSLDEGLADDYLDYKDLGIRFTSNTSPENAPENMKVDYKYGYSSVPSDLKQAATEMVMDDLVRGTVSGAMVDGRDDFDPQTVDVQKDEYMTVLDRYRVMRMENINNLAVEGSIS